MPIELEYQSVSKPAGDAPLWRKIVAVALVLAGLEIYRRQLPAVSLHHWRRIPSTFGPLAIVLLIGLITFWPALRRRTAAAIERAKDPSPWRRRLLTLLIWVLATSYLAFTAWRQQRDFDFKTQDEFMYLIQVQAIAHGHLWMPPHPMEDFFQEFYIFVQPVTSGMYFPGAAMMFAPAVWLHLPYAAIALMICGAVVAMTFRVIAELLDGVSGILAALLMVALTLFRSVSPLTLSYMPMALLGLLMIWAWLHWRKQRRIRWILVLGAIAGWAAVTRPLDAIAFFVPTCVLMAIDWIRAKDRKPIEILWTVVGLIVSAAPFLAMQFALDKAVTGHWLTTPVQRYQEQFWPGTVGGVHPHLLPGEYRPDTPLPQFQVNYDEFVLPHFRKARSLSEPFVKEIQYGVPHPLLIPLLLVSVVGVSQRRRAILWSILPIFLAAYLCWVMFISWYALVIAPVVMFAIVLGRQALIETFSKRAEFLSVWLTGSIIAAALFSLPEIDRTPDKTTDSVVMSTYNHLAATEIHSPALVFFRYHAEVKGLWKHEQTYNVDAAHFDDEAIVRAHDLGDRNLELIDYYAKLGQNRTVYLYDQVTMELRRLGTVHELTGNTDLLSKQLQAVQIPTTALKPATAPVKRRH